MIMRPVSGKNRRGQKIRVLALLLSFLLMLSAQTALAAEDDWPGDLPEDGILSDIPLEEVPLNDAPTESSGIVDPLLPYDSARLNRDVLTVAETYPEILSLTSIGESALGNDIPLLKLGKGKRPVLWIGALHAREAMTTGVLMLLAEEYARAYCQYTEYGDIPAEKVQWLLEEFTVYIVPMANPDGVDIVTADGAANVKITNRKTWKSNANGVNLNMNFPFAWEKNGKNTGSNYLSYKGTSGGSEAETQALMALCASVPFEHMVSCHCMGKILYWRDDKNGKVPGDRDLAEKIAQITGYSMMPSTENAASGYAGGFENWFRYTYNKPGICLEFGRLNTADRETMEKFYTPDMANWPRSKHLLFGVLDMLSNLTATPTASTVYVNGEPVRFDAYTVGGNNYFKLRDLAYILSGTEKQFEVEWSGAADAIVLTAGLPYTLVGGEMEGKGADTQKPVPTKSTVWLDGQRVKVKACLIRGNNYFKLRDIGALFDFDVSWYGDANAIMIETGASYTED